MRRSPLFLVPLAVALLCAAGCGTGSERVVARSPFFLADSLRAYRRFAAAHPEYRRLRDSFAIAGDTAGWFRAQIWWSETLMRQARIDSADAALREALQLAGSDSSRHAWALSFICNLKSRQGRSDEAIADCDHAMDLATRLGLGDLQAKVEFHLGTIYSRRGLYRRSVQVTERALELERSYPSTENQLAGVLNSMGIEYAAAGRLTEAAAAYEEGLAITRRIADTATGGYLLSNLAALRAYTGRYDQAVELMTQSLASAHAVADSSSMVYAHNSLAEYLLKVNNVPAAREHVEQALALNAGPAIYRVIALIDLGMIGIAENQPDSARAAFDQALPLALSGGFNFERFRILAAQVRLAVGRGDRTSARRMVGVARIVADSLGSPEVDLDLLALEGSVAELERRPEASLFFLKGIDLLESWRGRLAMGDLRLGITEPKWSVYEGAIRTLFDQGKAAEAFDVSERARARMLLEVMAERSATHDTSPEGIIKRRLRERFEESTAGGDTSQVRIVSAEIRALQDSLALLERSDPAPAALAGIQSRLLNGETALLSMFWGDSAVYGWSVTASGIRGLRLGRSDSLEASVEFLRRTIERPGDSLWRAAASRVYRQVVAPLGVENASTILAIMDGPLTRLPLEVLLPAPDARPLGATHRIVYGPSASVLAALGDTRTPGRWERSLLAVGNPRGDAAPDTTGGRRSGRSGLNLPFAEEEATALADLYRGGGADLLVGRAGTLARWLELKPERYRYLHFATHANVDDREPEQTRLILAGGTLDPAAIRQLDLTAELVTLSACETALGRRVRGEGVVGLSHAFLAAGARGIIVTLWPVTDRSTLRFMTDLYTELHAGRSPAEALRLVRQRWIQTASADAHPAYWAPFILLGDPGLPPP